jgi:hypothetical protein
LELYLNTMENIVFEFSILYIVYCAHFGLRSDILDSMSHS